MPRIHRVPHCERVGHLLFIRLPGVSQPILESALERWIALLSNVNLNSLSDGRLDGRPGVMDGKGECRRTAGPRPRCPEAAPRREERTGRAGRTWADGLGIRADQTFNPCREGSSPSALTTSPGASAHFPWAGAIFSQVRRLVPISSEDLVIYGSSFVAHPLASIIPWSSLRCVSSFIWRQFPGGAV